MTTYKMTALTRLLGLTSVVFAVACSGSDPKSTASQNQLLNDQGSAQDDGADDASEADDEGGADKIYCSADTDCDSDEACMSGKCTGLDGDTEDDADDATGEADDGADDAAEADDAADDEGGADKIYCSADTDCDSDEVCKDGLCT